MNHRQTRRSVQLSGVWVHSEHPNKHWDPERNQQVPSPEGFSVLAQTPAQPRPSPVFPPLSLPVCGRAPAGIRLLGSPEPSALARLASPLPGNGRFSPRSGIPQSSSSGKIRRPRRLSVRLLLLEVSNWEDRRTQLVGNLCEIPVRRKQTIQQLMK